jgi:hypothetical protein
VPFLSLAFPICCCGRLAEENLNLVYTGFRQIRICLVVILRESRLIRVVASWYKNDHALAGTSKQNAVRNASPSRAGPATRANPSVSA